MKISLNNLKLKQDFDRIEVYHWAHFSLLVLALFFDAVHSVSFLSGMVKILIIFGFYRFYFKTKKELYYSYWSFSAILLVFIASQLFFGPSTALIVSFCYLLAATVLGLEMYFLNSPIYFPRVMWWEYDFRYRDDLPIYACLESLSFCPEGRLTDMRRDAGCVVLFDDLNVGEILDIIPQVEKFRGQKFKAEILSKRQYSIGRPYNYGVKFLIEDERTGEVLKTFSDFWKHEKHSKKTLKYT